MLLERLGIVVHRFPHQQKDTKIASVMRRVDEMRRLAAQGYGDMRIAKHFGVSEYTVRKARKKLGLPPQPQAQAKWAARRDELLRMRRAGMSASEIAAELGESRNAICGACHRLAIDADEAVRERIKVQRREAANRLAIANRQSLKGAAKKAADKKAAGPAMDKTYNWRLHMRAKAPPPDSATRCTILEIEYGRCHYIVDDAGQFYCGAESETELGVWCPYHANFVFNRMSGDVGGSPAAASQTGVESVHNSVGGQVTARPHQTQKAEAA